MSIPQPKFCPLCGAGLESRRIEDRDRLACPAPGCGWVFWDNPIPVVGAIVEYGQDVILVQNHGWPPDWWGLVTGFLERDESPEQGVLREVAEELGLEAQLAGFVGLYPFFQRNQLVMAFHVQAQGEIILGAELAKYRAVPIYKLRPWPGATGQAVADWLAMRRERVG